MKIVQCVPNFSEGKDLEIIEAIVSPLKNKPGFKLISYEPDANYNRTVVTLLGDPYAISEAIIEMVEQTTKYIDLNKHHGEHPRMGAIDVIPFIPIANIKMKECVKIATSLGKTINEKFNIPIYLYEEAATNPKHVNLADVRKGEFEGLDDKMKDPDFYPDFGSNSKHPTAGATAVCAREVLIAYNIDLNTTNIEIADNIAKAIRNSSGGFRYIKAGSANIPDKGIVQVTMNITNYKKTSIYRVFETVKMEAKRYGVEVLGSEIVGLTPMRALCESLAYYLGLHDFDQNKIIDTHLVDLK